jgi:hypothetical protein
MPDNPAVTGGQDRQRISVNQDHELRDWAARFGVTKDELRAAVAAVGDRADKVEQYLTTQRQG